MYTWYNLIRANISDVVYNKGPIYSIGTSKVYSFYKSLRNFTIYKGELNQGEGLVQFKSLLLYLLITNKVSASPSIHKYYNLSTIYNSREVQLTRVLIVRSYREIVEYYSRVYSNSYQGSYLKTLKVLLPTLSLLIAIILALLLNIILYWSY